MKLYITIVWEKGSNRQKNDGNNQKNYRNLREQGMQKAEKQEIISNFGHSPKDCGSSDVQIALLTKRITELTQHCRTHPKDVHSRRGLQMLVNKRRKHLKYLRENAFDRYQSIVKELHLRS